ncbi:hypothetical protein [Mesorhizobium sophorae]|uniref:hypothetical protein n=1 Tax=Mesorhizobium sophorae TaxID=1300294 RepID=UPI00142DADBE|nr:hypothetical protein [Mesorhizobium sophorae]
MMLQTRAAIGILELDEGHELGESLRAPRDHSLLNPATFDRPIVTEIVEGAFAETVIAGDPSLQDACIRAARRLVERGAGVIVGDCGFLIRHQAAVSAAVNIPVAMSSLLLIPALLRQLAPAQKLAVITANSVYCTEDMFGIEDPANRARVVVGGIECGEYVRNAVARPLVRTSIDTIEREVAECIAQLRATHPEIGMLLFECTGLPVVANALRSSTQLPIYDITDLCKLTLGSVACN